MESIGKIAKFDRKTSAIVKPDSHLHSPAHLLADELCQRLNDKRHFGFYLKMATLYDHNYLRGLAGQILESSTVKTPGKLFAYLIKKNNTQKSDPNATNFRQPADPNAPNSDNSDVLGD